MVAFHRTTKVQTSVPPPSNKVSCCIFLGLPPHYSHTDLELERMTNDLNDQVNDQILLLSQYYPDIYTQLEPAEQGSDMKPRRRRKKSKAEASNSGFRKRKLSEEQVNTLELNFGNEHKLESERKDRLAAQLGLDPRQVAVWFQNRRARWRSKKLEEEYSKLKSEHESTIIEICQLETEVLELKERVLKADKEVQKLLERSEGGSINSPSFSFSMEVINPPFLGEFGMEGLENVCYMHENDYSNQGLEYWANLYDM